MTYRYARTKSLWAHHQHVLEHTTVFRSIDTSHYIDTTESRTTTLTISDTLMTNNYCHNIIRSAMLLRFKRYAPLLCMLEISMYIYVHHQYTHRHVMTWAVSTRKVEKQLSVPSRIYTVDRKKHGSTFDIITLEKHARFL